MSSEIADIERSLDVREFLAQSRARVDNELAGLVPGENVEPALNLNFGGESLLAWLAGWKDIDGDGIIDCVDPEITPTADNVDGDFLPDRFDPDLTLKHRPYNWRWVP